MSSAVSTVVAFLAATSLGARAADMLTGLWLLPRHDAQNTARADVTADFTQPPAEIWSFGANRQAYDYLRPITVAGTACYFARIRSTLEAVRADGSRIWNLPGIGASSVLEVLDFGDRGAAALVATGNSGLALVDGATGKVPWRWRLPSGVSSVGGPKLWKSGDTWWLAIFPQGTLEGQCWKFTAPDEPARLLWKQEYPNRYWANFGPFPIIADMDNDGREDIVLTGKPAYVGVIDAGTGAMKFDLKYTIAGEDGIGRPYGLIQAVDLDGDGFRDVVVASCQVEEYIAVLRNDGGKAFKLAWSHFVEPDHPDDFRELRPQITSIADLDGDGRKEIVLGLFNEEEDGRWRTVVLDALAGWDARRYEFADRYFWGCYDLDGDGQPEIIISSEKGRRVQPMTTLHAIDGRTGKAIASVKNGAFSTASTPLPPDVAFHANRSTPIYAELPESRPAGLVVRRGSSSTESLWTLANGASQFAPFTSAPDARIAFMSQPGRRLIQPDLTIANSQSVAATPAVSGPLVSIIAGKRELIASRSDGSIIGGVIDWKHPGDFTTSWTARGVNPSVWIGLDGTRLVAAFDPITDRLHINRPELGQNDPAPIASIALPHEPFRSAGMILPWGATEPRFYVGMKTGVHTCASGVYDEHGNKVWLDEKNGPYPRPAGVLDPQRGTLIVDDHGRHLLYEPDGAKRMIAHGWNNSIPGRGDGAKYALPIIGPFGPDGATRIVMSPGLETLEILDASGSRLARGVHGGIYEREWCGSAVARIRSAGTSEWDLGMLARDGVFYCADLATGQTRWSFNTKIEAAYPTRVVSGDIDGNGRDNFVTGLSDGQLLALDERDGKGSVVWRVELGAAIRDVVIADLDGDAKGEIIVETDDGRIHVLGRRINQEGSKPDGR
jgi:outer membrane protein assembly factor BamB